MEKAKISVHQLFVMLIFFELVSTIVVGFGAEMKQDAWISVLLGMCAGLGLFLIYYRLFTYYPEVPLTESVQLILGKWLGRCIALVYILYFLFNAAYV